MSASFNQIISLDTNYLYITRSGSVAGKTINSVGRWDGSANTMDAVLNGVNALGISIINGPASDDLFVAGTFTQAGGSVPVNRVAYYYNNTWHDLNGASVFDANVTNLVYDHTNDILYAASHQTTNSVNRIGKWDGATWTGIAEPTINSYAKMALDSNGNLYVGYSFTFKRYLFATSTWETISTSIGGTINDIRYNSINNRIYICLNATSNNVKYYDIDGSSIETMVTAPGRPYAICFDSSNNEIISNMSASVFTDTVAKFNGVSWTGLYNYINTSGVLEVEIDANGNIFGLANAGSLVVGEPPYANGNWQSVSSSTQINYGGPSQLEFGDSGGDPHVAPLIGDTHLLDNSWKQVKLYENNETKYKIVGTCEKLTKNLIDTLHRMNKNKDVIKITNESYVRELTYFTNLDILYKNEMIGKIDMLKGNYKVHRLHRNLIKRTEESKGMYSLTHKIYYEKKNNKALRVNLGMDSLIVTIDNYWDDVNHLRLLVPSKKNLVNNRSGELIMHNENNCLSKNLCDIFDLAGFRFNV